MMAATTNTNSSTPSIDAVGEDVTILQRLRWIQYPFDERSFSADESGNNNNNKRELYWPALYYMSHQEAIDFGNHQAFQNLVAMGVLEYMMNDQDDDDYDNDDDANASGNKNKNDPGPVCRLLGFDDGTYLEVPGDEGPTVLKFGQNLTKFYVSEGKKDEVFDLKVPEEQVLWETYQKAVQQINGNRKRRIASRNIRRNKLRLNKNNATTTTTTTAEEASKDTNDDANKENVDNYYDGGGGGNGGDDSHGDDKPSGALAAAPKVTFQVAAPRVRNTMVHNSNEGNATNNPDVEMQDLSETQTQSNTKGHEDTHMQENSQDEKQPANEEKEEEEEEATNENAQVMVQVTASSPSLAAVTASAKEPPTTPPFHLQSWVHHVKATEPWTNIWNRMRQSGWARRTDFNNIDNDDDDDEEDRFIYTKPGRDANGGVEGVDFFTSEAAVQAYVQSKIREWRPPAWVEPPAVAAARVPAARNRAALSSSLTVITNESSSYSGAATYPATRERRSTTLGPSKYNQQVSLANYQIKDKLWWRKNTVPTFSQVKPSLLKLGIRKSSIGNFELPEKVNCDDDFPGLRGTDNLRKFLCTKGIPHVPGVDLLNEEENELLHQWVSFAYVPLQDLGTKDLRRVDLPNQDKLEHLVQKLKFQKCDDQYFPPHVDRSGARSYERKEGVHFFRGLAQLREYIRRTASFSWTNDDLLESDVDVQGFPYEKALFRLWAASSPSPLPTYETSLAEIEHMEKIIPEAACDFDSDIEEEQTSTMQSEQEEDSSVASTEEDSSAVSSAVESSDNVSESEESSDASSIAKSDEDFDEEVEVDLSEPVQAAKKDKINEKEANTKPIKRTKTNQRDLPWWQAEPFPSFETMKPILKKLGIVEDDCGHYVLPGRSDRLESPESVRKFMCTNGIPFYNDEASKPKLTTRQKEDLRRWVSFAHVPVKHEDCVDELTTKALPHYKKIFATGAETRILPFLTSVGFQRNVYGTGFFPPGIDKISREKTVRIKHVKQDIPAIREYIRCSARLTLPNKGDAIEDSSLCNDAGKLLALRLWAALEPKELLKYPVDESASTNASQPAASARASSSLSKQQKKKNRKAVEPEPLNIPKWWSEGEKLLHEKIKEVRVKEMKAKATSSKRKPRDLKFHMSIGELELAHFVRERVETIIRSSLSSQNPKSLDDVLHEICALDDELTVFNAKYFLEGDDKEMLYQTQIEAIEKTFRLWLFLQEGGTRSAYHNLVASTHDDAPSPARFDASDDKRKHGRRNIHDKSSLTALAGTIPRGSMVSHVEDLTEEPESEGSVSRVARGEAVDILAARRYAAAKTEDEEMLDDGINVDGDEQKDSAHVQTPGKGEPSGDRTADGSKKHFAQEGGCANNKGATLSEPCETITVGDKTSRNSHESSQPLAIELAEEQEVSLCAENNTAAVAEGQPTNKGRENDVFLATQPDEEQQDSCKKREEPVLAHGKPDQRECDNATYFFAITQPDGELEDENNQDSEHGELAEAQSNVQERTVNAHGTTRNGCMVENATAHGASSCDGQVVHDQQCAASSSNKGDAGACTMADVVMDPLMTDLTETGVRLEESADDTKMSKPITVERKCTQGGSENGLANHMTESASVLDKDDDYMFRACLSPVNLEPTSNAIVFEDDHDNYREARRVTDIGGGGHFLTQPESQEEDWEN